MGTPSASLTPTTMIPRNGDVAPARGDVYSLLHDYTANEVHALLYERMTLMIGNSVGFLLSGIALAFGISSILLLSSKGRSLSRRDTILRTCTIVLLFFVIAFQIQALFKTLLPVILFFRSVEDRRTVAAKATITSNLNIVVTAGLPDGLLVWRCFMVQRVLNGNSSKWGNIFWIFPACLWTVTVATAITITAMVVGARSAVGYTANITLNLYATLFISIRLLLHRRMITAHLGTTVGTAQHIYIVGILLESAAINVPVTFACAVSVGIGTTLEDVMLPIAVASQALASVLIIHQAVMGKVLSRQLEFERPNPMETRERSDSGILESTA